MLQLLADSVLCEVIPRPPLVAGPASGGLTLSSSHPPVSVGARQSPLLVPVQSLTSGNLGLVTHVL